MLCRSFSLIRAMALIFDFLSIDLIGGLSIKCGMWPVLVIMNQPCGNILPSLKAILKGVKIYTFIFQTAPQTFDEHIVHPRALGTELAYGGAEGTLAEAIRDSSQSNINQAGQKIIDRSLNSSLDKKPFSTFLMTFLHMTTRIAPILS